MTLYKLILVIGLPLINFVLTEQNWDDGHLQCPHQCFCQNAHLMDLSIARWINKVQKSSSKGKKADNEDDDLVNNNEVIFEDDDSFETNPIIKFAMCMLQTGAVPKDLINALPYDVQALVLLYNGIGQNITVLTSDIRILTDLKTLEIRGTSDRSFHLIIDQSLNFLENANFESIELIGNESSNRPKNPKHPSESFDYVPHSEKVAYNLSMEVAEEEIEILPYDVYLMEKRKTRMASFYGWDSLSVLRIHNCKLDELHWEMFDGLNSLQHLSLEHNEIKIIPAFAFYGALHIKTLSLAHNHILDLHYRSLAGLLDLEFLDLSDNNMSKLSELTFPPFPKLQYLDMRHNPIRLILPVTFGVMNNTRTFYLGSNDADLELTANKPFDSLDLLQHLSISNVTILKLTQNIFRGLPNLQIMKLKGSIKKIEFDAFADMEKLREIDLSYCGITDISMDAFIGCKSLEIVDLSNNNLTYIPPGLLDDQTSLTEVYLNNNRLRHLPSNFFTNPSLRLARLIDNPWKCTCDMAIWKPGVTNQVRGPTQERCVRDFHSGKVISCRMLDNYKFDNKLSPRCTNIKGRTVYYALRKDLLCDFKKELQRHLKQQSLSGVQESKHKQLENRRDRQKERLNKKRIDKTAENRREERKLGYSKKVRKTIREMNTVRHMSENNARFFNDTTINKNILGDVEEHDSINYI